MLPNTLRDFFTKEIYSTIDTAQSNFINPGELPNIKKPNSSDIRTVNHILLYGNGNINLQVQVPLDFISEIQLNIKDMDKEKESYHFSKGNFNVFYTIRKVNIENSFLNSQSETGYLVSFIHDSYREDLVNTLYKKLVSITMLILLISFIPAFLLSKYLSKPLVNLEKKVKNLSDRKWKEPIIVDRKDEIGQLGNSIESLRLELIRQESLQNNFIQNVSHELKTPIMVIKSYTQAIEDGIYPLGDINSSLEIITNETIRLENKVKSLLYISKLDYMEGYKIDKTTFDLKNLIDSLIIKYKTVNKDIKLINSLSTYDLNADFEQINIVLENIIDNMMRYARTQITFTLEDNTLKIFNDGEKINQPEHIFDKFYKGKYGEIGLGLSIVHKIIDLHNFNIYVENLDNGVCFSIDINLR